MSFFERTIFRSPIRFIPFAMALDGMRRVWLGGTNLSFFIDLAAGHPLPTESHLLMMQLYIDQEKALWAKMPWIFRVPLTPFIDYTAACDAVLTMFKNISPNPLYDCKTCADVRALRHTQEPSIL